MGCMDIWTHKTLWRMLAVDKSIWKFLPFFYPIFFFFPGSPCVICGPVLRIIAYSLEYLPRHLLEMEPLLYPAGRYLDISSSPRAFPVQQQSCPAGM